MPASPESYWSATTVIVKVKFVITNEPGGTFDTEIECQTRHDVGQAYTQAYKRFSDWLVERVVYTATITNEDAEEATVIETAAPPGAWPPGIFPNSDWFGNRL